MTDHPYRTSEEPPLEHDTILVKLGSVERNGPWTVARNLDVRVFWGNAELDFREAILAPGTTTIHVQVKMGNLELIVPEQLAVEVSVSSVVGNVQDHREGRGNIDPNLPKLRIVGTVGMGNCEIFTLAPGEKKHDAHRRRHHDAHWGRHEFQRKQHEIAKQLRVGQRRRRERWRQMQAEREIWVRASDRQRWVPWWLMSRMRRRMFSWLAIAFAGGIAVGVYLWPVHHWWYFPLAFAGLAMLAGSAAFRLTRPLVYVIKAATDIGDGKYDTRIDPRLHSGEMRVLASAINEMADKIQTQLSDQRQLLAAVSHELRTPLGHMRVLVETARDTKDLSKLGELEREVLVVDDLVGRLLAQSRLEFGTLDRRDVDLGELVADVATGSGLSPDAISADGDVRASVDPTLFRRALANLVDNARVHGGGAVAVRACRRGPQIAIEVDDAGPGVPEERRAEAFRAFSPSSGGGLGLGLALVSRIAVAHGGGAWIADRPGGGARVGFTVDLGTVSTNETYGA
ncbi:MAG TPA: ATP-binding protein [Kofleriaceae bacterium]|jgi:signal transduction histidine kinase